MYPLKIVVVGHIGPGDTCMSSAIHEVLLRDTLREVVFVNGEAITQAAETLKQADIAAGESFKELAKAEMLQAFDNAEPFLITKRPEIDYHAPCMRKGHIRDYKYHK